MKIIPNTEFPAGLKLWGISPRQIEAEERAELKKDAHIMQLRYAAMEFCSSDALSWEGDIFTFGEIESAASVCGDCLNLNNFEGYRLSDNLKLSYLYMNTDERMCAAVYDENEDDFTYWCIY